MILLVKLMSDNVIESGCGNNDNDTLSLVIIVTIFYNAITDMILCIFSDAIGHVLMWFVVIILHQLISISLLFLNLQSYQVFHSYFKSSIFIFIT